MSNKYIDSLPDWEDIKKELDFTQEEWDEINLNVKIAGERMKARENKQLAQQPFVYTQTPQQA